MNGWTVWLIVILISAGACFWQMSRTLDLIDQYLDSVEMKNETR